MIYFYDYNIKNFPQDMTECYDVRNWEYWTLTPGEDIQCFLTEHKLLGDNWRVISNNPGRYTTLVAKRRFI